MLSFPGETLRMNEALWPQGRLTKLISEFPALREGMNLMSRFQNSKKFAILIPHLF